jgi:hypothetical protein
MGRAIKVVIGGKIFPKKGELTEYMRAMVARYNIGDYISNDDMKFCLELFESHSEYPKKLAPGISKIQLLIQKEGSKGFQIHKTNGTSDDISWTDCVANRK